MNHLTSSPQDDRFNPIKQWGWNMSNEGRVWPREKCPVCGAKFEHVDNDLICPLHLTRPKRVYIQIRHKGIYSDREGKPFYGYEHAKRWLDRMRTEIDEGSFDLSRYVARELKPLLFSNWSETWLERLKTKVGQGKRAPSYLKAVKYIILSVMDFYATISSGIANK